MEWIDIAQIAITLLTVALNLYYCYILRAFYYETCTSINRILHLREVSRKHGIVLGPLPELKRPANRYWAMVIVAVVSLISQMYLAAISSVIAAYVANRTYKDISRLYAKHGFSKES